MNRSEPTTKLRVVPYGTYGHQIHAALVGHPRAVLHGVAAFGDAAVADLTARAGALRTYATLDEVLADPDVDLVSLCSPRRADQAEDARRCLRAGKHVYAEKPCALTEAALDALLAEAARCGRRFHEMAGTAFAQPYRAMRDLVRSGALGTVVQVFVQKSYPYHARRPQDEDVDGGLILQNGVHAARFVEHITGLRIRDVQAMETTLGNPVTGGGLRMAAGAVARLENGGLATFVINYLNQPGLKRWGNEAVRVFGTAGFAEAVDGGTRHRVVIGDQDSPLPGADGPGLEWFDAVAAEILDGTPLPLTLEEELHPLRAVIRMRAVARRQASIA